MSAIIRLFSARRNSRGRFEALLRPHIDLMYRMAWHWTGSQDDAEDLVLDILVRLAKRVDEMERIDVLRPWLLRILYNRYVDLYRRRRSSPVEQPTHTDDTAEDPLARAADSRDPIEQMALQRTLALALRELDDDQRDVVLLHDVEGYTAIEVSDILDISVGTVKSRLSRARGKLKKRLADTPGDFL